MKVGIVGAGLQGRRRAQAIMSSVCPGCEVVAVSDIRLESAKSLGAEIGCYATSRWEEIVSSKETDLVIVCTPPDLHAPISIAALRGGKHVLCEKPLARDIAEAMDMVRVSEQKGLVLKCGFNLRHHPGIEQAKKWIDDGAIGRVFTLRCVYGVGGKEGYECDWRARPETCGGGQLMDQGVHGLDLARWFLGDFVEVSAMVGTLYWKMPVEDNAFCLMRTGDGRIASVQVSWTQWKPYFSFELTGNEGYVKVEGLGGAYGVERVAQGRRDFTAPFEEKVIEYRGVDRSWELEWREFVAAVREGRQPIGSGWDGLKAVELANALYQSATKKQHVDIKDKKL